jgi:hypothetical protein
VGLEATLNAKLRQRPAARAVGAVRFRVKPFLKAH